MSKGDFFLMVVLSTWSTPYLVSDIAICLLERGAHHHRFTINVNF
jgi:hypothetical protein